MGRKSIRIFNGILDTSTLKNDLKREISYNKALREVKADWKNLEKYSQIYGDEPNIVRIAVKQNGMALEFARDLGYYEKDITFIAVRNNPHAIQFASDELKRDNALIWIALRGDPTSYMHVAKVVRNDKEMSRYVLKKLPELQDGIDLNYAVRAERREALEAVIRDGLSLKHYWRFADDKDLVLKAVAENGMALEYADDALKRNETVVMKALEQNPEAHKFVPEIFIKENKVVRKKVKACIKSIEEHKKNFANALRQVRENPRELANINIYYYSEEEVKDILKEALRELKDKVKNSKEIEDVLDIVEKKYASFLEDRMVKIDFDDCQNKLNRLKTSEEQKRKEREEEERKEEQARNEEQERKEEREREKIKQTTLENIKKQIIEKAQSDPETLGDSLGSWKYELSNESITQILIAALDQPESKMNNIENVLKIVRENSPEEVLEDPRVQAYLNRWENELTARKEASEARLKSFEKEDEEEKLKEPDKYKTIDNFQSVKEKVAENPEELANINIYQFTYEEIIEILIVALTNSFGKDAENILSIINEKYAAYSRDSRVEVYIKTLEKELKNKVTREFEEESQAESDKNKLFEEFKELKYKINKKKREIAQNVIKELVANKGTLLEKVPVYLQNEEIVKEAVKNDWRALKFVYIGFRTPEILKIALEQSLFAEEFLTEDEKRLMADVINQIKKVLEEKAKREREALKAKIAANWEELGNIEANMQDEELAMIALKQNIMAYKYVSEFILKNSYKVRSYLEKTLDKKEEEVREGAKETLSEIYKVIEQDGMALQFVKENQTELMVKIAVEQNGKALEYVDPSFITLDLAEKAVAQNTNAMESVFKFIKQGHLSMHECTNLICMTAKKDGNILRFLIDYLEKTNEAIGPYIYIISDAISQNGESLKYIKGKGIQNYGMVAGAIKKDGTLIRHVDDNIVKNSVNSSNCKNLEELAVNQNGMALQFIKNPDRHIIRLALEQNGMALQFVELKSFDKVRIELFVAIAIHNNEEAARFVTDEVKKFLTPEFCEKIDALQAKIKEKEEEEEKQIRITRLQEVRAEYNEKKEIVNDNEKTIARLEERLRDVRKKLKEIREIRHDVGLDK